MALIRFFEPRHRYGWLMVVMASIILGMGMGSLFSISVFLKPLADHFGWLRGDTSFAYTSAAVLNGVSGIFMGALADRFTTRPVVLCGAIVMGGSLMLLSKIESLWQFYTLYGPLIGGLGVGAFLTPLLANVGFWFETNRGLAIGAVMGGQSLGGATIPVLSRYLISEIGWRDTYFVMGVAAWVVLIPLALLIREPPGMEAAKQESRDLAAAGRRTGNLLIEPQRLALVLCVAIIFCCICMSIPVVHLAPLATDNGIPPQSAAAILSAMMMVSMIGRVGIGKVADMIGSVRALLLASTAQTVFVFWFTQMYSVPGFLFLAVLFGIGYGGVIPAYAIILREMAPVHMMGRLMGMVFFSGNFGMGTGGYLGGLLFDLSGSYVLPYSVAAATGVVNMIIVGSLLFFLNSRASAARLAETRAA